MGKSLSQRLWDKVRKTSDCWVWQGANNNGYGCIKVSGTNKYVHRVAWELENGPIPEGLTIDHLCKNRACVRLSHLELVTLQENLFRRWGSTSTHYGCGHPKEGRGRCIPCNQDWHKQYQRTTPWKDG